MSEFKYLSKEEIKIPANSENDSNLIQLEIAHQLKRIADALQHKAKRDD